MEATLPSSYGVSEACSALCCRGLLLTCRSWCPPRVRRRRTRGTTLLSTWTRAHGTSPCRWRAGRCCRRLQRSPSSHASRWVVCTTASTSAALRRQHPSSALCATMPQTSTAPHSSISTTGVATTSQWLAPTTRRVALSPVHTPTGMRCG